MGMACGNSGALVHAGLVDKDRTMEAFERVAMLSAGQIGRALDSTGGLLHYDPPAKALRKKVALPD
jgi:hypothetical protein